MSVPLKNMTNQLTDPNDLAILNGETEVPNDGFAAPLDGSSAGGEFTTSGSSSSSGLTASGAQSLHGAASLLKEAVHRL